MNKKEIYEKIELSVNNFIDTDTNGKELIREECIRHLKDYLKGVVIGMLVRREDFIINKVREIKGDSNEIDKVLKILDNNSIVLSKIAHEEDLS